MSHRGLYRYKRLPFGVSSVPGTFQCIIDNLIKDIPHVCAYQDDILTTGRSEEEHLDILRRVLRRLAKSGFKLKKEKCKFLADFVEYLGFKVDYQGLHIIEAKTKAIQNAPPPKNVSELKSFLGMVNHLSHFVRNCAALLTPLHQLLKKNHRWIWSTKEPNLVQNCRWY